mmetsp:Transcript_11370/g.18497  ORF Transcript_11370/g.18497 Transcript_11370/m.18497 type:complete len:247 (+) Transcript_11370:58-798(+)
MSISEPLVSRDKFFIHYMAVGVAFDDNKKAGDHVMLACHQRDQKLSKIVKSLESIFHHNLKNESYSVESYSFQDHQEGFTSHYFITDGGVYCFLVTLSSYSHRCANKLLTEFIELFISNYKKKIAKCKHDALTKAATSQFVDIFEKYEDVESIDALLRADQKLNDAKTAMSDNVSLLLENQDNLERVYHKSQDLNRDAAMFKKNTKKLKYNMLCRSRKWCIISTVVCLVVLAGIAGVAYFVLTSTS